MEKNLFVEFLRVLRNGCFEDHALSKRKGARRNAQKPKNQQRQRPLKKRSKFFIYFCFPSSFKLRIEIWYATK